MWLDRPEQWDRLAGKLLAAGEAGIDSETYNQPHKTSPQHRARVHCWSIGVLGPTQNPRGYRQGHGVALPVSALTHYKLREALQQIALYAHNAPHDIHSFANEGLVLDITDTLQWSRVAVPGKPGYGIKSHGATQGLEAWALGKPDRADFLTMVKYQATEVVTKRKTIKRCVCGAEPCRKRGASEWFDDALGWFRPHERQETVVETQTERQVERRYEITEFVPGHPRWDAWVAYAVADAVSGIEIVDWLRNLRVRDTSYPWSAK